MGELNKKIKEIMRDLRDMLTEKTVKLNTTASDWKEAVRMGGRMLVDVKACKPEYVDAMVRFAEELGPYIVIGKGLALPHARPEEGVLETCFSLLTLSEPIEFGNEYNDPVYVIFCMAARDKDEHIEALRQIANLCGDEFYFEKIKSATTLKEIQDLLEKAGDLK
jgi:mannitol/fructose-specific phosphotransferase system IIA component (Ntr-type)